MRTEAMIGIVIVTIAGMLFATISYTNYLNRDKPHVFTAEEIFKTECAKRAGNPTIKEEHEATGSNTGDVTEYKCEATNDIHN